MDAETNDERLSSIRERARAQLARAKETGGLSVLLTGGTGFIGMECVDRFARDATIRRVHCLIRPRTLHGRAGQIIKRQSPAERGAELLENLLIPPALREKFRFWDGDIEQPLMGLGERIADLAPEITHVVHAAASVAFDEPYESARRANFLAVRNALELSTALRAATASRFVAHVTIETAYINGRTLGGLAEERELRMPRGLYSNYYELTKAMGSIVARRLMLERQLPVVQLLPAIVVGRAACGSNHGDRKVLNAPLNVLATLGGQAEASGSRLRRLLARHLVVFPGDPDAELNLVAVDRVAEGIRRSLEIPEAVGRRIFLATSAPIALKRLAEISREEFGVGRILSPAWFLLLVMPLLTLLARFARGRLRRLFASLHESARVFRTYCERGQPVYRLEADEKVLGLTPAEAAEPLVRQVCRHNRYVFLGSKSRRLVELERRAITWRKALARLADRFGCSAAEISAPDFHANIGETLDLERFALRGDAATEQAKREAGAQ